MFRKSFLFVIFAALVPLAVSVTAYAQTAPLAGTVALQKDGKDEPVANALVEVYRTDIKGFYKTQTNKKGEFRFVGILYGDYVIAVSAPGASPTVFPGVRAGKEDVRIVMYPGDGRKYTEEEAKQAAANASSQSGGSDSGGMSDEQKKAQEEFNRKNAEITAKNEKIKAGDAIAAKAFQEGKAAKEAKNYDLAIAKFNEGIEAVPDFVGSTPILLNLKMEALKDKGFLAYREGAGTADLTMRQAKFEEANKSYEDGLTAFQMALGVISRAEPTTDAAELKRRDKMKYELYRVAAEIHRLKIAGGVDMSKINEATTVISDYLALENNPELKLTMQMGMGDMMTRAGEFEKAVTAYREVLVLKPDHAEAMGRLGLALFAVGTANEDKDMQQEGLNFMQKYIDLAPVSPTDSQAVKELKISIKESVDYLKSQKMTPQKAPAAGKKKS